MSKRLRCFVVDESSKFLQAAGFFLAMQPSVEVIGLSPGREGTFRRVMTLRPDVVLVDLALIRKEGLFVIQGLKSLQKPPYVVIMSQGNGTEYRSRAIEAGADAFVVKSDFTAAMKPLLSRFQRDNGLREQGGRDKIVECAK